MNTKIFTKSPSRNQAFTLVELLVVIGIIAVLAAILLPALTAAKDRGLRTVCINNLKTMAAANRMYVDDNQDWLAPLTWGPPQFACYAYDYINGQIPDPGRGGAYEFNPGAAYQTGLWFQYMPNPKSYLCPVDIQSPSYTGKPDGGIRTRLNRITTYLMNGAVCGYGVGTAKGVYSCKITVAWSPLCVLLWEPDENAIAPGVPGAFDFNGASNYPGYGEGIGRLHSRKGGSVLTLMGNVQFTTIDQWNQDANTPVGRGPGPGGKTYNWWSPFSTDGH